MSRGSTSVAETADRRPNSWLAWTCITLGGLVAALCGGVSMFLGLAIFLSNDMSNPDNVYWLLYFLALGGVPALIGLVVLGVGILLLRRLQRRVAHG